MAHLFKTEIEAIPNDPTESFNATVQAMNETHHDMVELFNDNFEDTQAEIDENEKAARDNRIAI